MVNQTYASPRSSKSNYKYLGCQRLYFSDEEMSKNCKELKKITSGQTNRQSHFHTMYEMRYLDRQTRFLALRDVYFDRWFGCASDAAESFDCDSEIGSSTVWSPKFEVRCPKSKFRSRNFFFGHSSQQKIWKKKISGHQKNYFCFIYN